MRRLQLLFLSALLSACSDAQQAQSMLLFDYDAFGPPAAANELIGMDWWQWEPTGDARPSAYAIKVVVYKDIDLEQVKQRYPVNAETEKDYRYVEYLAAMAYLDQMIQDNVIESLTHELIRTRAKIREAFADNKADSIPHSE